MPRIPVNEIKEGDSVDQVFMVRDCRFLTTRKGQPFATLRLGDQTGVIAGIFWDLPEDAAELLRSCRYVRAKGVVGTYQNAPQITVELIQNANLTPEEAREFLPQTQQDVETLFARLVEIMGAISDPFLSAFTNAVLADEQLSAALKAAPAAVTMHHAYVGGLLEHTVSMAEAALKLCEHYTFLNRELLLTGVLIHDIGKVHEFAYEDAIEYSDSGRLVGHTGIGISIVEQIARGIEGFPPALLDVLKHYILSHHGVPEFGAVRAPMTAEALVLHYIDNMDAKLAAFTEAVGDPAVEGLNWTPWQKMFEGYLYKGDPLGSGESESGERQDEATFHNGGDGGGLFPGG